MKLLPESSEVFGEGEVNNLIDYKIANMPKIDMHTHSHYSDGDLSPTELMIKAKQIGLAGAVLTDHTVLTGLDEAKQAADKLGLLTCEGVEINGVYKKTGVHILGYSKQFDRNVLMKGLRESIQGDNDYNQAITDKLRQLEIIDIDFDQLLKENNGIVIKIHVLKELINKTNLTHEQALTLTSRGGEASVPYNEKLIAVHQAVHLINKAGGKAVLAHPAEFFKRCPEDYDKAKKQLNQMVDELIGVGLFGMESQSGRHTPEQNTEYTQLAQEKNLFKTVGSDFHGKYHPKLRMGSAGISLVEFNDFLNRLN